MYCQEINTKVASAKVFAKEYDSAAMSQVYAMLELPYMQGSKIRFMPDMHAGAGCTIGTTMTITDKICPNFVGVDIGCGMETVRIAEKRIDFEKLDNLIREKIPSGMNVRDKALLRAYTLGLRELRCVNSVDLDRAYKSIGTLGGGNHFIEVDRDNAGNLYIVIHSGSRHLGVQIAKYYQDRAYKHLDEDRRDRISNEINILRTQGKHTEIDSAIKRIRDVHPFYSKDTAYVSDKLFEDYLHDMAIAQTYAAINRRAMMDIIIEGMGLTVVEQFSTIHNYIDLDNMILRKGAVSAQKGEKLIIPINMRDGSLICTGKGNEDWNYSAPHGAGRLFSRGEAKEKFTVEEFETEMRGIYSTSVNQSTLDESPMAYKSMDAILECIEDTVTVDNIVKPVYNFKAN